MTPANDNSPWPRRIDEIAKVVMTALVGLGVPIAWAVSWAIQELRPFG